MIRIFTSPSCSSCRKVKAWFDEQKIPYEAVNIFGDDFTKDDIRELIAKSENGTDDIISPRSKIVQENLGHATAAFTLDVYAHATERMKRDSANRMEALFQSTKKAASSL